MKSLKAVSAAALLTAAAALTACSNGGDETPAPEPVQWNSASSCDLADPATLEPLLTTGITEGTASSVNGDTSCLWGSVEQMNTVSVALNSSPQDLPELRTIDVVGQKGRVLAESKYQCTIEFETDSGVVTVEGKFGFDAMANPDTSCNRVVPLAEEVLENLAWSK
ncbi:MAG: hypothetical protein GX542_01210 [Rhodococcus sp.]|nr:hypothetical protein [Rhodococcus sp. (in: high G+C Gram-positive bacteria)]